MLQRVNLFWRETKRRGKSKPRKDHRNRQMKSNTLYTVKQHHYRDTDNKHKLMGDRIREEKRAVPFLVIVYSGKSK